MADAQLGTTVMTQWLTVQGCSAQQIDELFRQGQNLRLLVGGERVTAAAGMAGLVAVSLVVIFLTVQI